MAASKVSIWIGLVAVAAAVLHWAMYQFGYVINSDNALMVEYASRWLNGGTVGVDIFDPNPPGSFLIYIPVVWLSVLIPVWHAMTLYTLSLVVLSVVAVWKLLPGAGAGADGRLTITLVYLLGNLFLANIFFGERDHLIFLGLMPFVLLQISLLTRPAQPTTRFEWAVLIAGAALIAVKPHYVLMPLLLVLWRLWQTKDIKGLCGPDVKALAGATVVYGILLALVFPGYLTDVMPEALSVYASDTDRARLTANIIALFMAGLAFALFSTIETPKASRQLVTFLMVLAGTLLVASLAQLKGYYYQAMPEFITIFVVVSYMFFIFLKGQKFTAQFAAGLTIMLAIGVCYAVAPPAKTYLTHDTFKDTAINKVFEGCPEPCSVFIFDEYPDITILASVYNDAKFASRFPSYWFLPEIAVGAEIIRRDKNDPLANSEAFSTRKAKYQAMVAEDLTRYQPDIIALVRTNLELPDETEFPFEFVKFFSENKEFAKLMKGYKKSGTFEIDRADYHRGTTLEAEKKDIFDIYKRK